MLPNSSNVDLTVPVTPLRSLGISFSHVGTGIFQYGSPMLSSDASLFPGATYFSPTPQVRQNTSRKRKNDENIPPTPALTPKKTKPGPVAGSRADKIKIATLSSLTVTDKPDENDRLSKAPPHVANLTRLRPETTAP